MLVIFVFAGCYRYPVLAQQWDEITKVIASDRSPGDHYGKSVAIYDEYAIVGAWVEDHDQNGKDSISNAGSAYILRNIGGKWSQVQKIVAKDRKPEQVFGHSVAIYGDYALIGSPYDDFDDSGNDSMSNSGAVYVFKNINNHWTQIQKLVASDRGAGDWFGHSIAMYKEYAIVGAYFDSKDVNGGNEIKTLALHMCSKKILANGVRYKN